MPRHRDFTRPKTTRKRRCQPLRNFDDLTSAEQVAVLLKMAAIVRVLVDKRREP